MNELVAIRRASGVRSLIRATDYDPTTHVLWDAPSPVADPPRPPAPEPAPEPSRKRGRPRKG